MQDILTRVVMFISRIHEYLNRINTNHDYNFTDKQLHLFVIAFIGMCIFGFVFVIFRGIEKRFQSAAMFIVSFIFTFTVLVVITFAIEIGQKVTNTGHMEFADIVYGLWGFLIAFAILLAFIGIAVLIKYLYKKRVKQQNPEA